MIKALNLKPGDKIALMLDGRCQIKEFAYRISDAGGIECLHFTDGSKVSVHFNRAFRRA